MKKNQDYKNEALAALKGNWAPAVAGAAIVMLISVVAVSPSWIRNMFLMGQLPLALSADMVDVLAWIGMPATLLIVYPMTIAYYQVHNTLLTEGDAAIPANLISYTFKNWVRNAWGCFLMYFFIILWSLLLFIPGIIKALAYSMTPFILKDYPELSANEAINLSCKMMKGHKFDFFYLNLSFIGWIFVTVLTVGIGTLWVAPYTYTAYAAFYQDVKNEYLNNNNNNN